MSQCARPARRGGGRCGGVPPVEPPWSRLCGDLPARRAGRRPGTADAVGMRVSVRRGAIHVGSVLLRVTLTNVRHHPCRFVGFV